MLNTTSIIALSFGTFITISKSINESALLFFLACISFGTFNL
ncbi:hypothetical protein [Clostridioides difficile]